MVQLLLEKGANVEAEDYLRRTPLLQAAENGHEAIARLLLKKGADVEANDYIGRTPLSWAIEKGQEAIVQLLAEVKARGGSWAGLVNN